MLKINNTLNISKKAHNEESKIPLSNTQPGTNIISLKNVFEK